MFSFCLFLLNSTILTRPKQNLSLFSQRPRRRSPMFYGSRRQRRQRWRTRARVSVAQAAKETETDARSSNRQRRRVRFFQLLFRWRVETWSFVVESTDARASFWSSTNRLFSLNSAQLSPINQKQETLKTFSQISWPLNKQTTNQAKDWSCI